MFDTHDIYDIVEWLVVRLVYFAYQKVQAR